jgi:hypothetical protein
MMTICSKHIVKLNQNLTVVRSTYRRSNPRKATPHISHNHTSGEQLQKLTHKQASEKSLFRRETSTFTARQNITPHRNLLSSKNRFTVSPPFIATHGFDRRHKNSVGSSSALNSPYGHRTASLLQKTHTHDSERNHTDIHRSSHCSATFASFISAYRSKFPLSTI